jgi:uncharacterized damage-inducible protein DinB
MENTPRLVINRFFTMFTKQTLLEQFNACFDTNGWFVSVRNAIAGVTAEQASWRPEDTDNSIIGLLSHMNYYNNAYLERFTGRDFEYKISDNDETFTQTTSDEDWRAEVERFDQIAAGWRSVIESADESKFDEMAPPKNESSWSTIIANINAHTAHHGGQIVLIRKLQGSWDSGKGVS